MIFKGIKGLIFLIIVSLTLFSSCSGTENNETTNSTTEAIMNNTLGYEQISGEQAKQFAAMFRAAEEFLKTKRAEFVSALSLNASSGEIVSKALSLLPPEDFIALCKEAEVKNEEAKPQLAHRMPAIKNTKNDKFKI